MTPKKYDESIDDFHRAVNFYRLYRVLTNPMGKRRDDPTAPKNWLEALKEIMDLSMEERTINGIVYEVEVDERRRAATIGMHKQLDPSLMSQINRGEESVADFKLESQGSGVLLAHASAVAITEIQGTLVVAIARGSSISVPRQRAVSIFFNHFFATEKGVNWAHKGLIVPADIERLKRANRIKQYTAKFIESPHTLKGALVQGKGPRKASRLIAKPLGGEVEILLNVKDVKNQRNVQEEMLEQVLTTNDGLWHGSVQRATAVIDNDEVVLDLIDHDMASTIYFSPPERATLTFSSLLKAVKLELLRLEEEVQKALSYRPS